MKNIEARPLWKPLHLQPVFSRSLFVGENEKTDVAQHLFQTGLCLPSGSSLTSAEQNIIIELLKSHLMK